MTLPCDDCGRTYEGELIVSRADWLRINPADGGTLCPTCMCARAARLGAQNVTGCMTTADDSFEVYEAIRGLSDFGDRREDQLTPSPSLADKGRTKFFHGSDEELILRLRTGARDLHPYSVGTVESPMLDVSLPAYINEAADRLANALEARALESPPLEPPK